jgi:hypothetical protein
MKTIITLFCLSIIFQVSEASSMEMEWSTSLGESAPSCALYRKRVANYYQRISEVEKAEYALKGNLSNAEISRMIELWQRTGVPLLTSSTAVFKTTIAVGELAKKIIDSPASVGVNVESELFNWESETFIFPEDIFKVTANQESESLLIEVTMPYAQACLKATDVFLTLSYKAANDSEHEFGVEFKMDKAEWERENL